MRGLTLGSQNFLFPHCLGPAPSPIICSLGCQEPWEVTREVTCRAPQSTRACSQTRSVTPDRGKSHSQGLQQQGPTLLVPLPTCPLCDRRPGSWLTVWDQTRGLHSRMSIQSSESPPSYPHSQYTDWGSHIRILQGRAEKVSQHLPAFQVQPAQGCTCPRCQ